MALRQQFGRRPPPVSKTKRYQFGTVGGVPFTPFVAPTRPPPGYYDPALDAQQRAAERGYRQLEEDIGADTGRYSQRALSDYLLAKQALDVSKTRGGEDIAQSRQRAGEDYGSSIDALNRRYLSLGNQQAQTTAAAGAQYGGALVQAARKRAQNQAVERAPIDTSYRRFGEDIGTSERRLGEDYATKSGALGVDYQRGTEDRGVQLRRAGGELAEFKLDLVPQRFWNARGSGYEPPVAPANERNAHGLAYQVKGKGLERRYTLPSGQTLSRREWVPYLRRRRNPWTP